MSSQKLHAASNDVISSGLVFFVITVLSQSLLKVLTAFSAAPLDCGWSADESLRTIPLSSRNSLNSCDLNSASPSVARQLGHVLRWKNVDSFLITVFALGPGVFFPFLSTVSSLAKYMYVHQLDR